MASNVGLIAFLLPYIEQDNVYNRIPSNPVAGQPSLWDINQPNDGRLAWWNYSWWTLAQSRFKVLQCPSADLYGGNPQGLAAQLFLITRPGGCAGGTCTVQTGVFGAGNNLGLTNYLGVCGSRGTGEMSLSPGSRTTHAWYRRYEGVFNNRSKVSIGNLTDGTSNTLMFGEYQGNDSPRYGATWMSFGVMATWRGLGGARGFSWGQFSSAHPAGVLFCRADGSVANFRRDGTAPPTGTYSHDGNPPVGMPSNWYVLQSLAGYRDGDVPPNTLE
jgi:hypothetical protein